MTRVTALWHVQCVLSPRKVSNPKQIRLGRMSLGFPVSHGAEIHTLHWNDRQMWGKEGGKMVSIVLLRIPSRFLYCSLQSIKCNFPASPKLERPDQKYRVSQLCGPCSN